MAAVNNPDHLFSFEDISRVMRGLDERGLDRYLLLASALIGLGLDGSFRRLARDVKAVKVAVAVIAGIVLFGRLGALLRRLAAIAGAAVDAVRRILGDSSPELRFLSDVVDELVALLSEFGRVIGGVIALVRAVLLLDQAFLTQTIDALDALGEPHG
jgi:hypothetical protein